MLSTFSARIGKVREMHGPEGDKRVLYRCAQNYSVTYCIVPVPYQKLISIWAPFSCRGLGRQTPRILREYDLATVILIQPLNSGTHMLKRLFGFCSHDLTQICEYDQDLLYKNAINRKNKQRKTFLLIVAMLTVIVLILFFPLIHDRFHLILLVGVTFQVPKSDNFP